MDGVDLVHQRAEHGALPAAGGHGAAGGLLVQVGNAGARGDSSRFGFPVDLDGGDVFDAADQALVTQIAQHERFGGTAQRHQRDEFALVEVDGERALAGNVDMASAAQLVEHFNLVEQWNGSVGQFWAQRHQCLRSNKNAHGKRAHGAAGTRPKADTVCGRSVRHDHAAGDAPAGIAGGLGHVVVLACVDDQRVADQAGGPGRQRHAGKNDRADSLAVGIGLQHRDVAGVMRALTRITVLLAGRVEVPPALLPSGEEQSPFSCTWKPNMPLAGRPEMSTAMATRLSPCCASFTLPCTVLPLLGASTADAVMAPSAALPALAVDAEFDAQPAIRPIAASAITSCFMCHLQSGFTRGADDCTAG
ncbi:hypothetical protein COLO4_00687 [Corchorus olitorius]|uniref:Uncharacterized protein n=1 Tax=Corchorus olitorius TaxID=93759 RepID=A0A1R3L3P7_9ROSI|nr:hypothetical protein COLO4_00687 [Corchorus olitorius]